MRAAQIAGSQAEGRDCIIIVGSPDVMITAPAPPPAVLGASATTNGITLTWPAALTNYILEAATNLFQPIPWLPVTNTPLPVGDRLTVTVPVSDYQFFRLHQQ